MFKDIDKVLGKAYYYEDEDNNRLYSTLRYLFCRLIDAYESFRSDFPQYESIPRFFRDFLLEDSDYFYKIFKGRENYYLSVQDDDCEYEIEKFKIPFCLLEDNWKEKLENDLVLKKVNALKKDIEKLEKVIAEAPDELTRLKNELAKYDKNE